MAFLANLLVSQGMLPWASQSVQTTYRSSGIRWSKKESYHKSEISLVRIWQARANFFIRRSLTVQAEVDRWMSHELVAQRKKQYRIGSNKSYVRLTVSDFSRVPMQLWQKLLFKRLDDLTPQLLPLLTSRVQDKDQSLVQHHRRQRTIGHSTSILVCAQTSK